jgi:hypothetical protein
MASQWFADLVRGLASDNAQSSDAPTELELLTDTCIVRAAPTEDGSALALTVRYRSPDDDAIFGSADVLQLQIRLHQSETTPDDWQFALTDDHAPVFARRVAPEEIDAAKFESVMQEALDHAGVMRDLAQTIHAFGHGERESPVMLMNLA